MVSDVIKGKYRIVREIGRSNDVVYEAIDSSAGRRLAIKELLVPANLTGQARRERIERFTREARATSKLSHPNIVTVFDHGEDNGRYFIAMEFLDGQTLRDLMQLRGALPIQEALDITYQVLAALSHAHAHKVIHRDIKPDNISILPGGQVKLTDFGIARLTEEASLTGEGQVFGTPSYMSPEQIEGKFVDNRSDIFSLAILLYEMLTGRKPFTGDSVVTITYNIMHTDPPPLNGIPFELEQVIFRAMSKDPNRRFRTADEFRDALRNPASAPPAAFFGGSPVQPNAGYPNTGYGQPSPTYGYQPQPQLPPPTAYGTYGSGQQGGSSAGGPFTNWNQPQAPYAATPAPTTANYPPPALPYSHKPRQPIIGDGVRTFIKVFLVAMAISGAILGLVLLFYTAFMEQQRRAPQLAAEQLIAQGATSYQNQDLEGARLKFEEAMRTSPDTPAGAKARHNLAIVYKSIGVRANEKRDYRGAAEAFAAIVMLYQDQGNALSADDRTLVDEARDYLDKLRSIGVTPMATNPAITPQSSSGTSGGSAINPNAAFQDAIAKAQADFNAGMQAYHDGDRAAARELWQQVISEAPGSDPALQAQHMLDQTATSPTG